MIKNIILLLLIAKIFCLFEDPDTERIKMREERRMNARNRKFSKKNVAVDTELNEDGILSLKQENFDAI